MSVVPSFILVAGRNFHAHIWTKRSGRGFTLVDFVVSYPAVIEQDLAMLTLEEKRNNLIATFQKIVLEAPELYANEGEKAACRRMIGALPDDLVEQAANTSYAYWYLAATTDTGPMEEVKVEMAMREARRHLAYMAGAYDKALNSLIESCQYRKVRDFLGGYW